MEGDKIYKAATALIIIGVVISIFPWFIIAGGTIYLLGIWIMFAAKASLKRKVITIFLPLIVWIPCMYLFVYLISHHVTPSAYLIPLNFRGKITIFYSEPCGEKLEKIDGKFTYKIPENGILILQNELETGNTDNKYYLVDVNGKIVEKIEPMKEQNEDVKKNDNHKNKVGIFNEECGGGNYGGGKEEIFISMRVIFNDDDSLRAYNARRSDSLGHELLVSCRNRI